MSTQTSSLTKYSPGSLRELWKIAIPLMLMSFSTYAMIFGDRIILGKYSADAMNSAALASMIYTIFFFGSLSLALIAEVFVGQYNGAKRFKEIGVPVWQMVWFGVLTTLVFWPVGIFGAKYTMAEEYLEHGESFLRILMIFGPLPIIAGALSAFFVGRGKAMIVTVMVAVANAINIVLDYFLVFGIEGVIEPMGTTGAALATGFSQLMQVVVFFCLFLKKKNREEYGTGNFRFNKESFMKCIKVGYPMSLSHTIALVAWALFFEYISTTGKLYMTALVLVQNYFFAFWFLYEGMGKAITTIASNLIGGKRHDLVSRLCKSAHKLNFIISCVLFVPLVIFAKPCIALFVSPDSGLNHELFCSTATTALFWLWLCFVANGFFWNYSGQLLAAGDTKFMMYANAIVAWVFLIIPVYLLIEYAGFTPDVSWQFMAIDIGLAALLFFWRYRSGKWKELEII